ncbi:hypothetical protein [Rhodococcus sp. AQ5-07]|nr:hypothetical protein [Rhodococcus sp. AQ5-07]
MTAALESRTETVGPSVAWTVPDYKIDGVTWYRPGEKINPRTGRHVMCTF